jgi:ATP-dependent RNA helicase DDX19/DBP5
VRQPLESLIITPSVQKQEMANNGSQSSFKLTSTNNPNQTSTTNELPRYAVSNAVAYPKKLSDPPTPVSEQSSSLHQDEEESDTPASLAENSLLSKQINTTLRDSSASAVDRTDPNSPLYSLKSFEELNLKPDLLKGEFMRY